MMPLVLDLHPVGMHFCFEVAGLGITVEREDDRGLAEAGLRMR